LNATQAAIRAGYSEKTAYAQGARLLNNAEIAAAVDAAKDERSEKVKIDAEWVLERLAAEAEADIADIYDDEGALLPIKQWPKIWRQGLVAGVDVEELTVDGVKMGIVRKIKVSDRIRRLELIGKHVRVNAFQETVVMKGLDTLADRMERAAKRDG
jgi:phage terminase small subunit